MKNLYLKLAWISILSFFGLLIAAAVLHVYTKTSAVPVVAVAVVCLFSFGYFQEKYEKL